MAQLYYNSNASGGATFSPVTAAMVGAAPASHSHNYFTKRGDNTITTTANDTTAKWGAYQNSVHFYSKTGQLTNQPSQYGYLINIGQGSEVHQLWATQSSGDLWHRGGNSSGWSGSWRRIVDSSDPEVCIQSGQPTNANAKIWIKG